MKRVVAHGLFSVSLLLPLSAVASPLDVPVDSWYSSTVSDFVNAGYFDETQPFRPTEKATRAEFVQLLVRLQGGVVHAPFTIQSFDDVAPNNPFFNYFEEAGLAGWIKGTGSCYGNHPCFANSNSQINRAEAATLMIRAFNLQMSDNAPNFTDNPSNQWFTLSINSAASLCILQGDKGAKRVRPADNMIRAEMITMLLRAKQNIHYPNCNAVSNYSLPNAPATNTQRGENTESRMSSSQASSILVIPEAESSSSLGGSVANYQVGVGGVYLCSYGPKYQLQACMEANFDAWKEARKLLTTKMDNMANQPNGRGCFSDLAQIDEDWVSNYNNYVALYNNRNNGGDWASAINTPEIRMGDVLKRITGAPTFCY